MVNNNHIVVYSKPHCHKCEMTKQFLTDQGVQFDVVDVTEDPDVIDVLQGHGMRSLPVTVINDDWEHAIIEFDIERLEQLADSWNV